MKASTFCLFTVDFQPATNETEKSNTGKLRRCKRCPIYNYPSVWCLLWTNLHHADEIDKTDETFNLIGFVL